MTKRVLLICQHFYPEMVSTGLHMTELSTAINNNDSREIEIEVLCSYPSIKGFTKEEVTSTYKNVRIIRKSYLGQQHGGIMSRLLFGFSFFVNVFFYIFVNHKRYKGFVITTNPPFLGLATIAIKKLFRKPYFLIVYDVYPDIAIKLDLLKERSFVARIWNSVTKMILRNAKYLAVIGRDMERILLDKEPSIGSKSILIPNWSDASHVKPIAKEDNLFLQAHPQLKDKTLFIYSGNMGRTHNMEDIISLANLFTDHKEIVFIIIGGGAKFDLVNEAAKKADNIMVLPYQPFEILPHVLNASTYSLVCLDKDFTGYSVPSKTYGVMAAAKPIIGFLQKDSEIGLAIQEANCGIVADPDADLNDVKKQILESLESGAYQVWGKNAYQAFLEHYTLESSAAKYNKIFAEIF